MKIYEFVYTGSYLGGVIIVVAKTISKAREIAKKDLLDCYDDESLKVVKETDITDNDDGVVIFNWDGDY